MALDSESIELCFATSEGFDVGRVIEEIDRYESMASRFGFSPVLSTRKLSSEVQVRLRTPHGECVNSLELNHEESHAVLGYICKVEEAVPDLFGYLNVTCVFYDRTARNVHLHGPFLGWHLRCDPSPASTWVRAVCAVDFEASHASSFVQLRDELADAGILDRNLVKTKPEARVARLRQKGQENANSEVQIDALFEAFNILPSRDLLAEVLMAACQTRSIVAFDKALQIAKKLKIEVDERREGALLAWRAFERGDEQCALELAESALNSDCRPTVALGVLVAIAAKSANWQAASVRQFALIQRQPNEWNLKRGLRFAFKIQDLVLAERMFAVSEGPLSADLLMTRAQVEEMAGKYDKCLTSLYEAIAQCDEVAEEFAMQVVDQAETALRFSVPAEKCEKILNLVELLRQSLPLAGGLIQTQASYLLAANLGQRCKELLPLLPDDAISSRLISTLRFRDGDYSQALRFGLSALKAGICESELIEDLMIAVGILKQESVLNDIVVLARDVIDGSELLQARLEETRNLIQNGK